MKRLIICLTLVSALALTAFAAGPGKCATTSVNVSATSITFGQSIQITGHFISCGSGLTNTYCAIFVRNPCLIDASGGIGYNVLFKTYVDIPAGETVDFTISFTPPCNDESGNWEAETYMRPRGNTNFIEASTDFTVTP